MLDLYIYDSETMQTQGPLMIMDLADMVSVGRSLAFSSVQCLSSERATLACYRLVEQVHYAILILRH